MAIKTLFTTKATEWVPVAPTTSRVVAIGHDSSLLLADVTSSITRSALRVRGSR
jgi:hypothetical protein